ncbi:GPP34 family phosphoprotein [Henriciella sp. AS95]|uniref:GOLPH3/VPS74 family protein n=1 Tax=Henriciella sp. AS95 TaxID=3135782 RepID=UPI00317CB62E
MSLTIPESLFLLSRKNDDGEKQGHMVEYAIAGGALADLMFRGRIAPDPDKPKKLVIEDASPVDDAFLNHCLETIVKKGPGKSISDYVWKLGNSSDLMRMQAESLVRQGILHEDKKSFLMFSWKNYPEANGQPEADMISRLSKAIAGKIDLSQEDCVTIALADKTFLLRKNFDKDLIKQNKDRIKAISKGAIGPTKAAMQAIDIVFTAIIAATVTSTGAASSG